jgi:hypothetical protein
MPANLSRASLVLESKKEVITTEALRILNSTWSKEYRNSLNALLKARSNTLTATTYQQWFLPHSRYNELDGAFNTESNFIIENCTSPLGCVINVILSPLIAVYLLTKYTHIKFKQSLTHNAPPETYAKKTLLLLTILANTFALTACFDPRIDAILTPKNSPSTEQKRIMTNNISFFILLTLSLPLWLYLFSKLTCMQRCNIKRVLQDIGESELKQTPINETNHHPIYRLEEIIRTLIEQGDIERAKNIFTQTRTDPNHQPQQETYSAHEMENTY